MLRRIVMAVVLAGLLTAGTMSGARAQQPASAGQPAANPSGWTFNVAPYVWFATINTTLNFNLPPALGGTVSADTVGRIRRLAVPPELRDDGCGGRAI